MNHCPHCGHPRNRVLETRENESENAVRRRRACRGCGKSFTTIERVETYQDGAWQPVALAAVPDPQPVAPLAPVAALRRRAAAAERLHPLTGDEDWLACFHPMPRDLFLGLLQWWNESRWGRHRLNATWTQAAFKMSANRVQGFVLTEETNVARALVDGGIEHGWQALKPEYLHGTVTAAPPAAASAGDEAAAAIRDMLERADAA